MVKIIDAIVKLGIATPVWLDWSLLAGLIVSLLVNDKTISKKNEYTNSKEIRIIALIISTLLVSCLVMLFCEGISEAILNNIKANSIYGTVESNYTDRSPIFFVSFCVPVVYQFVLLLIFHKHGKIANFIFIFMILIINFLVFWGFVNIFDRIDSSITYWNRLYHDINMFIYFPPAFLSVFTSTSVLAAITAINIDFDIRVKYNDRKYRCTGKTSKNKKCKIYVDYKGGRCRYHKK